MSITSLALSLSVLAFVVGLGDMLGGYDRYIYCELFDRGADVLQKGQDYFNTDNPIMGYRSEIVYVVWNYIVAHVTMNRYIYILLTTLLVYILLFKSFKDYISDYPFLLLMFMGMWFFFTFTYLRQVIAASVAWYGYRYVIDKKFWKFLIVAFIVFRLHNSGIIYAVAYFIPLKKLPRSLVIGLMAIITLVGLSGAPSSLFDAYGTVTDEQFRIRGYNETGVFRYEYIIEAYFFLYVILGMYKRIPNDRKSMVFLNAGLVFCAILLLFVRSSNGGRLSWYYMIGALVTVSYLVQNIKDKLYMMVIYSVNTMLFLRFIIFWSFMISPYKTFLTDGHREGDLTFYEFEYDDKYDTDKFYRKPFVLFGSDGDNSNAGVQ